jgi:hypothetical protein
VTLRARAVEERTVLPSGREVLLRIGLVDDPYIERKELDTVSLVLSSGDEVLAAVNTILEPEHVSEARALAREAAAGLAAGDVEPTAEGLEPFASRIPDVR